MPDFDVYFNVYQNCSISLIPQAHHFSQAFLSRHPTAIILAVARVAARTSAANEPRHSSRLRCDLLTIAVRQSVVCVEREHIARIWPADQQRREANALDDDAVLI